MTLYYKDKNGDNKWHELLAIEPNVDLFCDEIPSRVLHLAVYHKSLRVRKRNQKRICNKYHKKLLKGNKWI